MARKKSQPLTTAEVRQLGDRLLTTSANVYHVAESLFGRSVEDDVFEQLEKIGIFKCVECNTWSLTSDRAYAGAETCAECESEPDPDL